MTSATPQHEASRQRQEMVEWFLRKGSDAWSDGDEQAFQQWLRHADNQRVYEAWTTDWALIDEMPKANANRLRAMVAADQRAEKKASVSRKFQSQRRWALAGGFGMAAVAVTGSWLGWQQFDAQAVYQQALSTRKGQQSEATLPDGSVVRLDTHTSLSVAFFRRHRQVKLDSGQAMFAVAKDADRPFKVIAGSIRITVIGTRFSVRLTPGIPGRDGVEVTVEEGKVRVEQDGAAPEQARDPSERFDLVAGQQLVFDADGRSPTLHTLAISDVASWRSMPLSFSNVPLSQAIAELARYGDIGITHVDPAVGDMRLTGTFDPRSPAAVLRLIAGSLPVKLVNVPAGFELRARP